MFEYSDVACSLLSTLLSAGVNWVWKTAFSVCNSSADRQKQKGRKSQNHCILSLSSETAWSLVNLSSHRNITSILSRYLSPGDSIFSPNANDFCGMRLALNWIHLVKYFSLLFEGEKKNLVNCWKCLCSKITSVLIGCSVF